MSERIRERASHDPSFVDQMIGEGKRQRNWYKVINKDTGEVVAESQRDSGYVEIRGSIAHTHPHPYGTGEDTKGSAHSMQNVIVRGDIKVTPEK